MKNHIHPYSGILFLLALGVLLLVTTCEETSIQPPDQTEGREYFPLELDKSWFYTVDSIVLIPVVNGVRYDTTRLEARETLVDTFTTANGRKWYRGERWERASESDSWRFKLSFALKADNERAERQEDNLTFTKLVFPARNARTWDGHTAFNEFTELVIGGEFLDVYAGWNYRYGEVDTPLTLSTGFTSEQALLVEQAEVDNLLDYRIAYERYAAGIGLVERYIDARHTQCRNCCNADTAPCLDLPWDVKAEKGFILHQVLNEYQ